MIYLIGGAPRTGKSILSQRISARLRIGFVSTDLLEELLRVKKEEGVKYEWDASPEAITAAAEWFYPYLERFIWGTSALTESYVIEGVDFLPLQVKQLSEKYPVRCVFLGRSKMTLEELDQFQGRSEGYARLPETMKRQIVWDVPRWSELIRQESERHDFPYVDMSGDFQVSLDKAEALLTANP